MRKNERSGHEQAMRRYWDEAARENALWYVDTSLSFDTPDVDRFMKTGRMIVAEALDDAPVRPKDSRLAIEIGSGLGRVCSALADRFERVIGVDVSPEMIQRARDLLSEPRISFQLGDGSSLQGIEDSVADLVLSFTVFQHIPQPSIIDGYIREAGRVLRPGGIFVFQWNNIAGPLRWAGRRIVLSILQKSGLRPERYRRHAPQFLGSRVPLTRIHNALEQGELDLRDTRGLGTLYAWAWAERLP